MRQPYRPYRQLTEADVGCHIFFKAFGKKRRANDFALDYIWPELVGRRVYLVADTFLVIENDEQHAARLARKASTSTGRARRRAALDNTAKAARPVLD